MRKKKTVPNPHMATLIAETLELMHIAEQTEEVGDCLVWTGAMSSTGYPIMKVHGCPCATVRRILVGLVGDRRGSKDLAPRQPVLMTCDERTCIDPKHMLISTTAAVAQRAADRGAFSSLARGAKIAASRRGNGKLTEEIAAEIRLSDESGPVLSQRYGVNRSLVNNIKRGLAWRDYSSPFAGLGARA